MTFVFRLSVLLVLGAATAVAQSADISIGVNGSLYSPVGTLSKRFVSAPGGSAFFYLHRGKPQWGGAVEYMKFTKMADGLSINRPVTDTVSGVPQETFYRIPIPRLTMSLEIAGAYVQARYELLRFDPLVVNIGFGMGLHYWLFKRNEYYDTLNVQTPLGTRTAAILSVPSLKQEDWSAGFNAGLDLGLRLFEPLSLNLGARYKLIVGELWPTLALDIESVSTLQLIDLRAGLSADF
jgi:hypothetical protein